MFRRNISLFLFIALFTVGSISVFAQDDTKTISGVVELKDDKGKKSAFEGAKIECYRIDVTESCGSVTSDAEGKFKIDVPKEAKVIFGVSGKGITPLVLTDVRMSETNAVNVKPGSGEVPSEFAVRKVAIDDAQKNGKLTDAQKANLDRIEKEAAEREARNAKASENNKRRGELLKEGNEAFKSKDFDVAIAKFDEGYKIDPEFVGSAPVFLNNKAAALIERAVINYNAAAKSGDKQRQGVSKTELVRDFTIALESVDKAYKMANAATSADNYSSSKKKTDIALSLGNAKDIFRILGIVNLTFATFAATEEDVAKAVALYKTGDAMLPKNPDVIAGLALAMYTSSAFNGSKDEARKSLDYWNQYKKLAPKDHKQQSAADDMIAILKDEIKQ